MYVLGYKPIFTVNIVSCSSGYCTLTLVLLLTCYLVHNVYMYEHICGTRDIHLVAGAFNYV